MTPRQIVALLLIVGGVLALAYRGFSYTKETHEAKIGPLELQVKEKEYVTLPVWLGAGAVVVGAALLVTGKKKG
jgi:drug/metabolite transporter (DMT)-like permease